MALELTRFERARIISARALQLAYGAPALIKPGKIISPYELAKEEFEKKASPLSVIRRLPNGQSLRIEVN
jgi:DNA-directed RNA polymerase subunit K